MIHWALDREQAETLVEMLEYLESEIEEYDDAYPLVNRSLGELRMLLTQDRLANPPSAQPSLPLRVISP